MNAVESEIQDRLLQFLSEEIKKGEISPGKKIPTEKELCEMFNISRYMVRNILWDLAKKEVIYKIRGKGTYVSFNKIKANWKIDKITSSPFRMTAPHLNPSSVLMRSEKSIVNKVLSSALQVNRNEEIYCIEVKRLFSQSAYNYSRSYIRTSFFPGLKEMFTGTESLHKVFTEKFGIVPKRSSLQIESKFADDQDLEIFQLEETIPLLVIKSVYTFGDNIPIEYRETYIRGDMCYIQFSMDNE